MSRGTRQVEGQAWNPGSASVPKGQMAKSQMLGHETPPWEGRKRGREETAPYTPSTKKQGWGAVRNQVRVSRESAELQSVLGQAGWGQLPPTEGGDWTGGRASPPRLCAGGSPAGEGAGGGRCRLERWGGRRVWGGGVRATAAPAQHHWLGDPEPLCPSLGFRPHRERRRGPAGLGSFSLGSWQGKLSRRGPPARQSVGEWGRGPRPCAHFWRPCDPSKHQSCPRRPPGGLACRPCPAAQTAVVLGSTGAGAEGSPQDRRRNIGLRHTLPSPTKSWPHREQGWPQLDSGGRWGLQGGACENSRGHSDP